MTAHPLDGLAPRGKPPATVRALETWIQQAEQKVGVGSRRLGWLVASSAVIAALQRVVHADGEPRFLIKGGAYLELRMGLRARATRDLDTLFRGRFEELLDVLDQALAEPFDGIAFRRTEPQEIGAAGRSVKPRRFDIMLDLRGKTWRRVTLEVAPDEGHAGARVERFPSLPLAHFGLSMPPTTAGLAIDYQVAQKLHACTDPHTREHPNDRVRDVVDLHLLKIAFYDGGAALASLKAACCDLFAERAKENAAAGGVRRPGWPPIVIAYAHWNADYSKCANEVGLPLPLAEAVEVLNRWVERIDQA